MSAAAFAGFALAAPLVFLRVGANFSTEPLKWHLESIYELGQQIVVMLVSVGLSLPRLRTMWNNAAVSLQARLHQVLGGMHSPSGVTEEWTFEMNTEAVRAAGGMLW